MKIAICGDVHMCKNSSIVNCNGERFSQRLENCVKSINWVEKTAEENKCDMIVYLGDFFDKPILDSETITAVQSIEWAEKPARVVVVGNHESTDIDLDCSTAHVLSDHMSVANKVCDDLSFDGAELIFLPYVTEANRKPLAEYLTFDNQHKRRIIFAHNDISGINYGPVVSQLGFTQEEILENCDMFIDGHLHNGQQIIKDRIITLGNITGQNFGEDARRYKHQMMILDTATLKYELIENPYAFNFYQFDVAEESDIASLSSVKSNSVISVKCKETLHARLKEAIATNNNVVASRVVLYRDSTTATTEDISDLTVDHLEKFVQCCRAKINNDAILESELAEICGRS